MTTEFFQVLFDRVLSETLTYKLVKLKKQKKKLESQEMNKKRRWRLESLHFKRKQDLTLSKWNISLAIFFFRDSF